MVLLKALPFLQIVIFGKAGTLAISNISTIIAILPDPRPKRTSPSLKKSV
jgi:hypothetical protein